jgi:shikimate kinase/IS1 family transposase
MNDALVDLRTRSSWALSRIAELVSVGRANGWLPGQPFEIPNIDAVLHGAAESSTSMQLLARLALTPNELDLLWLLVCIELEPQVSRAAQQLGPSELTAQLLERLVTRGEAIDVNLFDRLSQLALIDVSNGPSSRRTVRVDERVVDLARGIFDVDRQLRGVARLEARREGLDIAVPERVQSALRALGTSVVAVGAEGSGRATLLGHAVSADGHNVMMVDTNALMSDKEAFARQIRAIVREARLHAAHPIFRDADDRYVELDRAMREFPETPLLVTLTRAVEQSARRVIACEIELPSVATRAKLWNRVLPTDVSAECARRYSITPGLIERCAQTLAGTSIESVQLALRTQLDRRLAGFARRIDTKQTWQDLVLPVDQMDLLIELVARVRHRHTVLETWGFADKVGRGLGLSALLSGPPGTGKTMIAGLVARELGLDLYQVDLSKLVSKYIGETEKQLATLFEAAESGHAILLFDEADSLFAKRTEVKTSNDRYANLEVNYLLQRIESFTGITLLTTNHETSIDPAFMRRLAFHIRVPMPDDRERQLLWRAMIPAKAARAKDLDFDALAAEFAMSGGYIKNAVLRAAYLCADEGTPITNANLLRGARAEYESMGKISYRAS